MKTLDKILIYNKISKDNVKISLMRDNPFAFFRGTAHLFFEHLSKYKNHKLFLNNELLCWIQGDCHINNLGFSNKKCSRIKDVRFNLNDFDEAFIGNPFLDVIRFGVSLGFFFDDLNYHQKDVMRSIELVHMDTEIIEYFLKKYLKYASNKKTIKLDFKNNLFMKEHRKKALKRADDEHEKSSINKFTNIVDDLRKFDYTNDKLEPITDKLKKQLIKELSKIYDKKDIIDICKRATAGVGSSNLDRYYMLLRYDGDVILLEIKEQINPAFIEYYDLFKDIYDTNHSQKSASSLHIEAKKNMIEHIDIHLKSFAFENKDFLIKSIFNAKYSLDGMDFFTNKSLDEFEQNLKEYINFCAITISNAHKKSALNKNDFISKMKKIKHKDFYEIFTIILKSYSTNLSLYSHFTRDLERI